MTVFRLLHSHAEHLDEGLISEIFNEIFLHGLLDTLKIIPFLLITYILMELLEHRASERLLGALQRSGRAGPLFGGLFGCVPQCGFGAMGASFYSTRVITIGTLIAIFLSTSDEMLPILISGKLDTLKILVFISYKAIVGIAIGFLVDFLVRLFKKSESDSSIHELCEGENCHCEKGIFRSALHHTLTIGLFLLIVTISINALVFFVDEESIHRIMYDKPFFSHLISALLGLIPNCAISVALTNLYVEGFITAGTMMSGLFSGAGVGLLVLFRTNRNSGRNLMILAILVLSGLIFGMLFDLIYPLIF